MTPRNNKAFSVFGMKNKIVGRSVANQNLQESQNYTDGNKNSFNDTFNNSNFRPTQVNTKFESMSPCHNNAIQQRNMTTLPRPRYK